MSHSPALPTCVDAAVDFAEPRVPLLIKKALCLLQGLAVLWAGCSHRLNLGAGTNVSCQYLKHRGNQQGRSQHGEQPRALQEKTSHAGGRAALWTLWVLSGQHGHLGLVALTRVDQNQADSVKPKAEHLPLQNLSSFRPILCGHL